VAKRVAVSFEAPCRARNFRIVAKVWPIYLKCAEMQCGGVKELKPYESRYLRYQIILGTFSPWHT
jgi:hypothetical protein